MTRTCAQNEGKTMNLITNFNFWSGYPVLVHLSEMETHSTCSPPLLALIYTLVQSSLSAIVKATIDRKCDILNFD